jgi:hypothetical protein
VQVELNNAVTALGKPTIAVISIGGPYAIVTVLRRPHVGEQLRDVRGERHVEISTSLLGVGRADAPRLRPRCASVPTLWGGGGYG